MTISRKLGARDAHEVITERETGAFAIPVDEPMVCSLEEQVPSGAILKYVLPLRWSLSFALTDKQWRVLVHP